MPPTRTRPPQLLIASHNHGAGSELLQLAERRGYAGRRPHSGAQAAERAHAAPTDLVVLDESLTDMDAFAATRALRDDDHVGPGTPLLLVSAQRPSSPQHHTALRAGVWEFLRHPLDRKSTRLNSSHGYISYAVFCLKNNNRIRAHFCVRVH